MVHTTYQSICLFNMIDLLLFITLASCVVFVFVLLSLFFSFIASILQSPSFYSIISTPYLSSFSSLQAPFKFIDRVFNGLEIQQYGDGTTSRGELLP